MEKVTSHSNIQLGTDKYLPPAPREQDEKKSSEGNSGSMRPYCRYGNAVKKLAKPALYHSDSLACQGHIFEKRAATVEVDPLISPCAETLKL